jgi:hypothetical protein
MGISIVLWKLIDLIEHLSKVALQMRLAARAAALIAQRASAL